MADLIPDEAQEAALQAVIDVRDAAPRVPNDADSFDVTMAALRAAAPLIVAAELDRLAAIPPGEGPWWAISTSIRARAAELRSTTEGDTTHG